MEFNNHSFEIFGFLVYFSIHILHIVRIQYKIVIFYKFNLEEKAVAAIEQQQNILQTCINNRSELIGNYIKKTFREYPVNIYYFCVSLVDKNVTY